MKIFLKILTNNHSLEPVLVQNTNDSEDRAIESLFGTLAALDVTTKMEGILYRNAVCSFLKLDLIRNRVMPPYYADCAPEKEIEVIIDRTLVGDGVFVVDYSIRVDF